MSVAARRSTVGVAGLNFGGKVLAVAKTMLVAALFGASGTLDAFWVAYTLPLLLPGILTTVITVAFVPRFMSSLQGRSGPAAWRGANTLFTLVLLVAIVAAALLWWGADGLVHHLAPGLAPDVHAEAVHLTRLLMPAVPLLCMSSLLAALSYANERFTFPALEGVTTNVIVILAALLLLRSMGIQALVVGVLGGFVLQSLLLLWSNRRMIRENLRPAAALNHPDFLKPLAHLLPLFVGSAGSVLNSLVNQYFVSGLDAGAISALAFAGMIAGMPVEVFAQAVMTTYYPGLGRSFARRDHAAASHAHADGLRFLLFLTLPAALLIALLAHPLVVLLLERGRFDAVASTQTAIVLALMAPSIVMRSVAYLNYRVLHAAIRPWTQVAIGLIGVALNVVLNALWVNRFGLAGIAVSTTVSSTVAALLSYAAARRVLQAPAPRTLRAEMATLLRMAVALIVPSALALLAVRAVVSFWPRPLQALLELGCAAPGLLCAAWVGWRARQPDLRAAIGRLRPDWAGE